jgi:hypothetical protein
VIVAKCKRCGTTVGCGCNLINGLCATCAEIERREKQNNELPTNKHQQEQEGVSNPDSGEESGRENIVYI